MLSIIYAILCIILPCAIYQIILIKHKKYKENLLPHLVWVYILLIYIYIIFSITGIGGIWDIGQYDQIIRLEEINLLPFQSDGIMTYALNIIMFMPLGFLLPLIWEKYRNPIKVFFTGFGFSLSIELCQLLNRRNTDIDDLLMNTLGAILGYLVWVLFKEIFKKTNKKAITLSQHEPIIYLVLSVLGILLLYNWRLFL